MSLRSVGITSAPSSVYASMSDIVRCFEDQKPLLTKLALLITGDEFVAARCVENARESTLRSHSPFRDWIVEWAKTATIQNALVRSARLIRSFEGVHKNQPCDHLEHLADDPERDFNGDLQNVLRADAHVVIANLDPLSRAVLVLRLALRSSIRECAFRLNVSPLAVLGANCRAMEWLASSCTTGAEEIAPDSLAFVRSENKTASLNA